ncbi:uncharacterized protein LOC143287463 isoform X2 [Babylonia areolata]|uniref:uncharacterized protein LOC143287463 isoform X2 n=1 Tax=Babylonia areolata TaxID=304850 RepID=UPI003FD0F7F2
MWLRALWYGLLDKQVPWPPVKAVLLTLFSAMAESVGLCLMCFSVLSRHPSPVSLLLLGTVLLVPACNVFPIVRAQRRRERVLVPIGILLILAGTVVTWVLVVDTTSDHKDLWHPAVAFVCLSVSWLPSLQRHISTARRHKDTQPRPADYGTFNPAFNSGDITSNSYSHTNNHTTTNTTATATATPTTATSEASIRSGDLSTNAAWKTAFIQNGARVIFIFIATGVLFMLDSGQSPSHVLTEDVHMAFLQAWDLAQYVQEPVTWLAFWLGLGSSFLAYVLAFAACHMKMAPVTLALPVLLALPLTLGLLALHPLCKVSDTCGWDMDHVIHLVAAGVCLTLGHAFAFGWYLFRQDLVLLLQESMVYYVPGYNGVTTDTWLTLNRRHGNRSSDVGGRQRLMRRRRREPKVYICTTMYREDEDEMRQLLESIRKINEAQAWGDRCFESHIIFDKGVEQMVLTEFALNLIALLEDTLGIRPDVCTKVITPYGMKLSWDLPGRHGRKMKFNIHLKDNLKVKNKKRWSQVMYMSYVLDFLTDADDEAFILTTDADVMFTPDSVEALLDLMTRDNSIGAVCARTHPMGGGPLVWYQVFEYAIGHWFQKTAEHALGSVLCAPGCFSVYRCRALAHVLPKYCKKVQTAFDFLTKDMGEDRWLCTLLVQCGWRIEYCAASENSTNCPGSFDEFYKQRRRWIASTLANLMLILREWRQLTLLNDRVPHIFIVYQALLLFSSLIGPSTIMLVVSGGLSYAWVMNPIATVVVQLLACIAFSVVCVYTSQKTQLTVAKLYTFLYAVVMTAVVVGTAVQIVDDINQPTAGQGPSSPPTNRTVVSTTLPPDLHISVDLPVSMTTLYFAGLVGIFFIAGLLHPREFVCLVYGVWYLPCLPSAYLVLTLYSVCNITDDSWGTREEATASSAMKKVSWQERWRKLFYEVFFCCDGGPEAARGNPAAEPPVPVRHPSVSLSMADEPGPQSYMSPQSYMGPHSMGPHSMGPHSMGPVASLGPEVEGASAMIYSEAAHELNDEIPVEIEPVPVGEWLPKEMRSEYLHLFEKHGFDNTLFITSMTEKDLRRIGVTLQGHLHYLTDQIKLIPAFEIEYKVPTNADEWLDEIGLPMYKRNFKENKIQQPKQMETLKSLGRKGIINELKIKKEGHIKRLEYAISKLRDPTDGQQKAMRMRQVIDDAVVHYLFQSNVAENDFWERLKKSCLEPDLKAFGPEAEVKAKLVNLRNEWLVVLAVSNILWLVLISTLAAQASLTVLGANPLGLVFVVIFGFLFVLQFLTMLVHRVYTMSHYLARAPYRCGQPMQTSWSMSGGADFEDTVDNMARQQAERDNQRALTRAKEKQKKIRAAERRSAVATNLV